MGVGTFRTGKWTTWRLINAIKVSPPWLKGLFFRGIKTVYFFTRFLGGKVEGIAFAPAAAKWGLVLRFRGERKPLSPSPLPPPSKVWEDCESVFASTGVWPISFSYWKPAPVRARSPKGFMCPIFPGHSYAYSDEAAYLETYGGFSFALTHKKGGWDCFRHLEILYSGAMVYMPDASEIPDFTMVHYPKALFAEVADHAYRFKPAVSPETRQAVLDYFNQHLTTKAMAAYLLRATCKSNQPKVLFIDEAAVLKVDYQSIFALIGLKQLLGKRVTVAFPVDYVYDDWTGDAGALYGRGFGYSRVLDRGLRNSNEAKSTNLDLSKRELEGFDLVVVGSLTRNLVLAHKLLGSFPAEKTIWIHGEDKGPSAAEISAFTSLGVNVFVRELAGK